VPASAPALLEVGEITIAVNSAATWFRKRDWLSEKQETRTITRHIAASHLRAPHQRSSPPGDIVSGGLRGSASVDAKRRYG
jgi:hypothetical protein